MIFFLYRLALLTLLTLPSWARAAPPEQFTIVTSEAVTVAGHEFCRHFIAAWRDLPGSEDTPLHLVERASPRYGSTMSIHSRQQRLLQLSLPPARAQLAVLAGNAADTVLAAARERERERRFVKDADLAADEF